MKCASDCMFLTFQILLFITTYLATEAMSRFIVELKLPRYVMVGDSALLQCDHNVRMEHLHRVNWLRNGKKIFQFVKGRTPPFSNFSIPGAELDWTESNENQIKLRNMDFEASGSYVCEVSTETPIYTKLSNDHDLTVIQKQRDPPEVLTSKPVYQVGERLEANCTSSPARPTAHITWLVNGEPVEESQLRRFPRDRERLTAQLSFDIVEFHVRHERRLELTCLSTIPGSLDPEQSEYADRKSSSVTVDIEFPQPSCCAAVSCLPLLLAVCLCILLR